MAGQNHIGFRLGLFPAFSLTRSGFAALPRREIHHAGFNSHRRRNLLYTAVTRGKKLAVLVGTKKTLGMDGHSQTIISVICAFMLLGFGVKFCF